uniref:non-specific serine/threonine protein kinase n=1 Tax=Hordeum vulgare subsp. vulgare TaxID=112509 RepID=A0A8I7BBG3_HORVV
MVLAESIGKYRVGRTIGEGAFAKVRLAVDAETGRCVAVKVIDRSTVLRNNLMYQVKREIGAMKLLNHPNIVKIHEVIATKTKICLVMEYVPGGQLSDKLSYLKRLDEREAKKYFYQLIDAVDYCHRRGVFHRDLKPENLLLDNQGNLKVSDFGLSVLRKVPGQLLSTSCGSPCYVAPEVIQHRTYDGAAADIWSCGVILFELLAGYLPFQDCSLINLYRRISRAQYALPQWITLPQKKIILRILDPSPITRAKINDIFDDEWFQEGYNPSVRRTESDYGDDCVDIDETGTNSDGSHSTEVREAGAANPEPEQFINAFRLIATCRDLDLSGLFQEQKTKLGSPHSVQETLEIITAAARDVSLSARRMGSSMVKLQDIRLLSRSMLDLTLSAEVIQVTPAHCVVEVSKSSGDLRAYKEFCTSLCRLLKRRVQQHGSSSDLETNLV